MVKKLDWYEVLQLYANKQTILLGIKDFNGAANWGRPHLYG